MPKRNRLASVLVIPVAVILWSVGWGLCWIGSRDVKIGSIKNRVQRGQSELSVAVNVTEQQYTT